jgi:hypothetical protein
MYLFTGDAPVREFAAQFPPPVRLAIQLAGRPPPAVAVLAEPNG